MADSHANEPHRSGPALVGRGFRVQRVDYANGYRRGPHDHATTGITLVLDGDLRERVGRVEEEASSLSVVFKPAGTVHANEVGPRGACTIALEILGEEVLPEGEVHPGLWRWCHAGAGVQPLLRLGRALVDPSAGPAAEEMVFELLGELLAAPGPPPGDPPSWVRRAREVLDDLAPEGIEVRKLAAMLRVHPVSLTRAFRRAYGVPVTAYRRRIRLRKAADQVAGTDRSLSAIAHSAGYADQPHMSREIRAVTGLTPILLRQLRAR